MSRLRPELSHTTAPAVPDETALYMIRDSVARRRELIRGALRDGDGRTCGVGAFFEDNPRAAMNTALVDEVAAYNDSVPSTATTKTRQRKVLTWLRWRLRVLAAGKAR